MRWGKCAAVGIAELALMPSPPSSRLSGSSPGRSAAEGLSGYLEYDYTRNDTENKDASGQSIQYKIGHLHPAVQPHARKAGLPEPELPRLRHFPEKGQLVRYRGGEKRHDDDHPPAVRRPEPADPALLRGRRLQPERGEGEDLRVSPSATIRESYLSTLYWKPDRFPDLKLTYSRDHLYDKDRSNLDIITDLYQAHHELPARGSPVALLPGHVQEHRAPGESDTTTKETINNGRVNYANNWWQRRVTFGLDYNYHAPRHRHLHFGHRRGGFPGLPVRRPVGFERHPGERRPRAEPGPDRRELRGRRRDQPGAPAARRGRAAQEHGPGLRRRTRKSIPCMSGSTGTWRRSPTPFPGGSTRARDNLNWVLRQTVVPGDLQPHLQPVRDPFRGRHGPVRQGGDRPPLPGGPVREPLPHILVTELQARDPQTRFGGGRETLHRPERQPGLPRGAPGVPST